MILSAQSTFWPIYLSWSLFQSTLICTLWVVYHFQWIYLNSKNCLGSVFIQFWQSWGGLLHLRSLGYWLLFCGFHGLFYVLWIQIQLRFIYLKVENWNHIQTLSLNYVYWRQQFSYHPSYFEYLASNYELKYCW